jgi:hypothetical protein
MDERFEKWAKKRGVDISPNNRTGVGYFYPQAQELWECWQEAQKRDSFTKSAEKWKKGFNSTVPSQPIGDSEWNAIIAFCWWLDKYFSPHP